MLKPTGVAIVGTGSFVPEKIVTNQDLEKMVDTSDEWIRTRTGIKERRLINDGTATSDLAYQASRRALETAPPPLSISGCTLVGMSRWE